MNNMIWGGARDYVVTSYLFYCFICFLSCYLSLSFLNLSRVVCNCVSGVEWIGVIGFYRGGPITSRERPQV